MTRVLYAKDYVESKSKKLSEKIKKENLNPIISTIRVGKDPGSVSYENGIKKSAEKLGVSVNLNIFDKDVEEDKILEKISYN